MKKIAVVGIGNLGMRHLQSLCDLEKCSLYGVEQNKERMVKMREFFKTKVELVETIRNLPQELDLAVIATNSNVRKDVLFELINRVRVKNIIFEKVLFQKIEHYDEVKKVLTQKQINSWVNCARREWPSYIKLKDFLGTDEPLVFSVKGGEWGMGCNAIHIIDLLYYFVGSNEDFQNDLIDISGLDDMVVESKRSGFYEIFGTLRGSIGRCSGFMLTCFKDSNLEIEISIDTPSKRIRILEGKQKLYLSQKYNGWNWEEFDFPTMLQSKLTKKEVTEILETGTCYLPTYEESMKLHLFLLKPLIHFFKKHGMEGELCPIT